MKGKKGLSAVIGMVFLLIVMISVLMPLAFTVTSTTSKAEENLNAVRPLLLNAEEQLREVNNENSPVAFYYDNATGKALIVYYSTPQVPINVSYFLGYKGDKIQVINPRPTQTTYQKYPALEYQVGNFDKLAMVTTLGNIIYADPMPKPQKSSSGSSSAQTSYWLYPLKTTYTAYADPKKVVVCTNPTAITSAWTPDGINNAALIVLKQAHKPLCINLTIHFTCWFATGKRNNGDVGTNIGIYSGSFYGQIEFGNYFIGQYSGAWPYRAYQCIFFNITPGVRPGAIGVNYACLGVLASCSRLVATTTASFFKLKYNYLVNIFIDCNCQIYIRLFEIKDGKYIPIKLPKIKPEYAPTEWDWYVIYEGNYNETQWGKIPPIPSGAYGPLKTYKQVQKCPDYVFPFGRIKATPVQKVVGYVNGQPAIYETVGYCPQVYPYDPLGVAIEILWGKDIYVSGIQIS